MTFDEEVKARIKAKISSTVFVTNIEYSQREYYRLLEMGTVIGEGSNYTDAEKDFLINLDTAMAGMNVGVVVGTVERRIRAGQRLSSQIMLVVGFSYQLAKKG